MPKVKVIIADDIDNIVESHKKIVSTFENMEIVGIAKDGQEEYDKIIELQPDLVITDNQMPKKNGIEVIEIINNSDIKHKPDFVLVTGDYGLEFNQKAYNLGVFKVIDKNSTENLLKQTLEDFLYLKNMDLYEILKELNIEFDEIEHTAVYTVEQAQEIKKQIEGTGCKNLFLTDKKGKYILVVIEENKKANLNEISKIVGTKKLSFASEEELKNVLKLGKGSVTPLGIINDKDSKVELLIDKELSGQKLLMHPNINTKTISIRYEDLIKFIEFEKNQYILI